ncbi:MAG TPA: hypothetical protein VD973_07050, partial [Symbiobacteriaceae bacterium]|nr:hypothetical protein [Symbiobacteriaceae bacterium]
QPAPPTADNPPPAPPAEKPAPPPTPDGARREEAGVTADTAYYIDIFDNRVELLAVPLKGDARKVATIPVKYAHAQAWSHLWEGNLALIVTPYQVGPGGALYRIDLKTCEVADLGAMVGPAFRLSSTLSADNRYLATMLSGYNVPFEIIDLQTGKRTTFKDEAIPMGARWSPTADFAAVLAAEQGSGLPAQIGSQYWDGGTHIDVIDARRTVHHVPPEPWGVNHLHPPQPLALTHGPVWSPDGSWLAVSAGTILPIGKGPGGGSQFEASEIWLVEVATNRWLRLGDVPPDHRLAQWPPEADRLIK